MHMPRRPTVQAAVIAFVVAIVGLYASPASAATPSLAVSNVTLTPLAFGQDSDAPDVIQTITWSNLPPGTVMQYRVPQALGMTGFDHEADYQCGGGGNGTWGQCTNLPASGSGEMLVHYTPREVTADYAGCGCTVSESLEVRVQALSLDAIGTATLAAKADLTLAVATPDQNTVVMTIFDRGPSNAARSTLTISGFLHLSLENGSACTATGNTITCTVPKIVARANAGGSCTPDTPPDCDQITLTLQPGWVRTRLTVRLTGYFSDPDPTSNTAVAFPDAKPPAATGTATRPGGASGGVTPTASTATSDAPQAGGTTATTSPDDSGTATPGGTVLGAHADQRPGGGRGSGLMLLGGGVIVVLIAGGLGVLFVARQRSRRRRGQPVAQPTEYGEIPTWSYRPGNDDPTRNHFPAQPRT